MREAVIVSTARTPIGKAYRGAFNDTHAQTLGGHAIAHALDARPCRGRRGRRRGDGRGAAAGLAGGNIARQSALRAGLPTSVAGMSVDRQCASGLMAIAIAAKEIVDDGMSIAVGGGLESISLVQNDKMNRYPRHGSVARRRIATTSTCRCSRPPRSSRRATRSRASGRTNTRLQSQSRTAAAQAAGRFDAEIVPLPSVMKVVDKATGAVSDKARHAEARRGRPRRHDARGSGRAEAGLHRGDPDRRSRANTSPPATPRNCPTAPAPAC